jgi:hypothetical protein
MINDMDDGDHDACHLPLPTMRVTLRCDGMEDGHFILSPQVDSSPGYWVAAKLAHPWCFGGRDDAPAEVAA